MNPYIDRVVISSNDDPTFYSFWPIVCTAWEKYFGVPVELAFVTDRNKNDPLVKKMKKCGNVHLFPTIDGIPTPNHAKVARLVLASKYGDEVCLVHDIDSIPLQSKYGNELLKQRIKNHVLCVGAELYYNTPHHGKFPMGWITTEGHTFKQLLNINNLSDEHLFNSWKNTQIFDNKEAINQHPNIFSDESLIRVCFRGSNVKQTHALINVDMKKDWIDRSWWNIDIQKLNNGQYTDCNFLRPFSTYKDQIRPIVEYVCGYYDENIILL